MDRDFELVVIGSGPSGQKAAIQAAKLGHRAAIVESGRMVGGVCVNTGTIPSKTLREAVLYLTGANQHAFYGQSYRVKDDITFDDLRVLTQKVIDREVDVIRSQLSRNHVRLLLGRARFVDPHTIGVVDGDGREELVTADHVVIAAGTRPARPQGVDFDDRTIIDSDGLLGLERIPGSMVVAGAGVIGVEYVSMFAALGVKVTMVEQRDHILPFCDEELIDGLQYHLRESGVTLRYGETVVGVDRPAGGTITQLKSGKRIAADTVLYSAGRQGAVDGLGLENVGLEADRGGRLKVDENFRTSTENIYAVGDVIGFPSLAATSMEQGRRAACAVFGVPVHTADTMMPIGIYSIPEISFVGRTEKELTDADVGYETGISRYRELARGQIMGDAHGMLKLLVSSNDRRLLGVHALGSSATELVHIGQAVMAHNGTVDYFVDNVFNYPTLAESYKVAALDASNKLGAVSRLGG